MQAILPNSLLQPVERFARQQGLDLGAEARWVLGLSDFAQWVAARQGQWLVEAVDAERFAVPLPERWLTDALERQLADVEDMPTLQERLRQLRNRCQLWVVWRHLLGQSTLEETVSVMSMMADHIIDAALDLVYRWEASREGSPTSSTGERQRLIVLALGKLGAEELNLSSDVDLIFAYPQEGTTESGKTNQQFFTRVGQQLINALDPVTVDGCVFRMDMRLRPYGDSGPLVMHCAAIEHYFETQGRGWERYAFIKARACAGDIEQGNALLRILQPFVYRRYLDFGALDALREMKARLLQQRHHPEDVKLGPGGIRDAEFAVQVQQLIHGGRQTSLQQRAFLPALAALRDAGHCAPESARDLSAAYRFLRDTEHSIQAEADRQSQRLPSSDLSRERLALSRGFDRYEDFLRTLGRHRAVVEAQFDRVVQIAVPPVGGGLWLARGNVAEFDRAGFEDPAATSDLLDGLAVARDRSSVAEAGRKCLDDLMPHLLQVVSQMQRPTLTLERIEPILRAVLRRSAYLVLLLENPRVLEHMVRLAGASRWLAEELARQPMFLNVLVDERAWNPVPDRDTLAAELAQRLARPPGEPAEAETLLDELRTFKEQHVFRVAVAELRGTLPLMHVSDYLTYLAEAVLQLALGFAWDEVARQHPEFSEPRPFIVVGYGKLGGLELGPGSDLDLVFVHDLPASASQFLHRLVRKLLHVLTVRTYLGPLYEIDVRLRPSGTSGMLVSSLSAFRDYQEKQAWVWEHQALVRARVVAGDPELARAFADFRQALLCRPRSRVELRAEVGNMRSRMARHHGQEHDLKRGVGGIVDIEFMVQYLVLAWAHEHPSLAAYSDNVRILEAAGRVGALTEQDATTLTSAYLALRSEWHRTMLDSIDRERSEQHLAGHREHVRRIWTQLFLEPRAL